MPERENLVYILPSNKNLEKLGAAAEEAIRKELSQLAEEKKACHPVKLDLLYHVERRMIVPSSMFVKKKCEPNWTCEKIK